MGYLLAGAATLLGAATGALVIRQYLVHGMRQLQEALQHEQQKRAADRQGRIKAEKALKQLRLELAVRPSSQPSSPSNLQAAEATAEQLSAEPNHRRPGTTAAGNHRSQVPAVFPFTAIGTLQSCFNSRTGTPRQPHLVPAARAVLQLGPGIPTSCLEGLEAYSHCWVLYVFHENTDLAKLLAARSANSSSPAGSSIHTAGVKSHIRVPRLNGAKMGVLATRSPHRPVPIGLSTAEVLKVDAAAGVLVLGGADIVDGSPVLDIKPYVPFCDSLPHATAPEWVRVAADEEPLALGSVVITPAAAAELTAAWERVRRKSLYSTAEQFIQLVSQVLARDIRSLHQRTNVLPVQGDAASQRQPAYQAGPPGAYCGDSAEASGPGRYTVALDGVLVSYDVCPDTGQIHVRSAAT